MDTVDQLNEALCIASESLASDPRFADNTTVQPYCTKLLEWVFSGEDRPYGSPTPLVQEVVRQAADAGLAEVFGDPNSSEIDAGLRMRRHLI